MNLIYETSVARRSGVAITDGDQIEVSVIVRQAFFATYNNCHFRPEEGDSVSTTTGAHCC